MPETKDELLQEFELLKTEYIKLLNDKDVLLNWGKPQLEALYSTRIGVHQLQRLQLQLRIKALKRKIELVQSAINRNIVPDVDAIELTVAEELAETEMQIMEQATEIEKAKHLLSHLDTPQRSAELRKIFKQLARQLHPDVNPDLTAEQTEIWHLIKDAYETGDLEKLKALQLVYEKEINQLKKQTEELTEEELSLRNATMKEGIKVLNDEIKNIRSEFPFNMEAQIKDDAWIAAQTNSIQQEIKQLKQYEQELLQQYTELINSYGSRTITY